MNLKNLILIVLLVQVIVFTSCSVDNEGESIINEGQPSTTIPTNDGTVLSGDITTTLVLDASKTYSLQAALTVKEGGVLTIPAGTTIKATGGSSSYIAVAQGGKINVNGTASSPVIMTSAEVSPSAGDWGGLVICGKAPTNLGKSATSEVADLTYGGTVSNDNSGVISYLRIEYSGATFNSTKEFNGLSLFGVGSETSISYVQSYEGGDDGIEFFGGTVSANYLISTNSGDDSIDLADGWSGTGSYWYVSGGAKAGLEISNNGDNGAVTPLTTVNLSNVSIVGPVTEGAIYFKEGGGDITISNLFLSNLNDEVVKVKTEDVNAINRLNNGLLVINDVNGVTDKATFSDDYDFTNYTSVTFSSTATGTENGASFPTWGLGWARE